MLIEMRAFTKLGYCDNLISIASALTCKLELSSRQQIRLYFHDTCDRHSQYYVDKTKLFIYECGPCFIITVILNGSKAVMCSSSVFHSSSGFFFLVLVCFLALVVKSGQ